MNRYQQHNMGRNKAMTFQVKGGWKQDGKIYTAPDGQRFTDFGKAIAHEIETKKEGKCSGK